MIDSMRNIINKLEYLNSVVIMPINITNSI